MAKKKTARRTTARKGAARKASAKRTSAKKASAKRAAAKKSPAKKIAKVAKRTTRAVKKVASRAVKKAKATGRRAARSARKATAAPRPNPPRPKDGRPPGGWPALSPYLTVRDADASIAFYRDAFGFQVEGTIMRDSGGRVMHAGMRLGDACIMFAPQGMSNEMRAPVDSGAPTSLSLYVYVPDVDALAVRAQSAGAALRQAPADQFWGDRIAIFTDPDGYHWTFATNVGEFDASKAPPM